MFVPYEVNCGGVYLPPLLVAGMVGLVLASVVTKTMTRLRLSRYFAAPPLVFVALVVLFSVLIESLGIVG